VCVSASVYSGADQSGKDLNDFINDDDDGENEGHGRSSLQQSQITADESVHNQPASLNLPLQRRPAFFWCARVSVFMFILWWVHA
jgi:hypothetical protein